MNILSNDLMKFDIFAKFVNYLWIGPIQFIVLVILLVLFVGYAALIGKYPSTMVENGKKHRQNK